jgi:chromosome segregation ATPase
VLFETKVSHLANINNCTTYNIHKCLATTVELRKEKQKLKDVESELSEYKQLISKSENQKLIALATKTELLTNQLNMAIERTNALHKKAIKESGLMSEENYLDSLKQQIEKLEKQLSEAKAAEIFRVKKQNDNNGQQTMPTADEVSHI